MSIKHEKPNKGVGGRTPSYSASFKVQLALEYLDGNYSVNQIARKYELQPSQVQWFVYWYRKNQGSIVIEEPSEAESAPLSLKDSKDLEKKLALAEMKIAALEKVIALANEEYSTDLKKKSCYQVIDELRGTRKYYSIDNLCAVFGYTRQAWYNYLKRSELQIYQEHIVLERIQEIRKELPKTGCIKLYKELNNGFLQSVGISMGRDAIFDLVRANGMLIKRKRKWVYTTNSFHRYKVHPDLVQRKPAIQAEEIWVSDITYLRTSNDFVYLSLVTDAYSRKIVGYHLADNLKAIGCIKALKSALKARMYPERTLIHHSDRGTQYCCDDYVAVLKNSGIQISMTQSGSPYDNAIAERVNGILKMEFDLERTFLSLKRATAAVEEAIYKYNHLRLHTSCNFKTPEKAHKFQDLPQTVRAKTVYVNKYQKKREETLVL